RHFSEMAPQERDDLAKLRVLTPTLLVAAGLWLQLALGAGLLVAARGWVGESVLRGVVLLPAVAAYAVGIATWLAQDRRVRRARAAWHERAWIDDLDPARIGAWRSDAGEAEQEEGERASRSVRLRRLALATNLATALVL